MNNEYYLMFIVIFVIQSFCYNASIACFLVNLCGKQDRCKIYGEENCFRFG
jgi:hypothetical protein